MKVQASEQCNYVRLDTKNGSMANVAPVVQRGGICYAVAATELFDAYRNRYNGATFEATSEKHIALLASVIHAFEKSTNPFEIDVNGGKPLDAIQALISEGGCKREIFNSKYNLYLLEIKINALMRMNFNHRQITINPKVMKVYLKKWIDKLVKCKPDEKNIIFSSTPIINEFDNVRSLLTNQNDGNEFLRDFVRQHLENTGMPIVTEFCSAPYLDWLQKITGDKCKPHSSLIIGRERNPETGKCQVLIRNSWGSEPVFTYQSNKVRVEGANFWVDEEDFYKNVINHQGQVFSLSH